MKEYKIRMWRLIRETATVNVMAESEDEALEIAEDVVFDWELIDEEIEDSEIVEIVEVEE